MSVLWILVPVAVAMAAGFVAAFLWAARSGQFDDLQTPGVRALTDDEAVAPPHTGDPQGQFKLEHVPISARELAAWNPHLNATTQPVPIRGGGTARAEVNLAR
jgi:cbb3-type cytochrome oxidase maturation protein